MKCPHCLKGAVTWPEGFFLANMYFPNITGSQFNCFSCDGVLKSTRLSAALFLTTYVLAMLIVTYTLGGLGCDLGRHGALLCNMVFGASFFVALPICGFISNFCGGWAKGKKNKPKPNVSNNYPRRLVLNLKVQNLIFGTCFSLLSVWAWNFNFKNLAYVNLLAAISLVSAGLAARWSFFSGFSPWDHFLRKTHFEPLISMFIPLFLGFFWLYIRSRSSVENLPRAFESLFFGLILIHLVFVLGAMRREFLANTRKSTKKAKAFR